MTPADDSGMLIQSRERFLPTEVMIMGEYFGFYGEMDAYEDRMEDMEMENTMLDDVEDYDDEEEWEDYDNEDIYDHDEYCGDW